MIINSRAFFIKVGAIALKLICSICNSSIIDKENNKWGLFNADNELLSVKINTIGWCATRFNSLQTKKKFFFVKIFYSINLRVEWNDVISE